MRGSSAPGSNLIRERQRQVLEVLAEAFSFGPADEGTPYLLQFVEAFLDLYEDDGAQVVNVLLDLSHGVFVDAQAAELWRRHYLGALRLDLALVRDPDLADTLERWRQQILDDPDVLYSRLGPQLPCQVPGTSVQLKALGSAAPLAFDLNTAQKGVTRSIPGITEAEVSSWMRGRAELPFADTDDFKSRSGLGEAVLKRLKFEP